MKLKSYLRGLGLGMIVTTIILVVTFKAGNHEMTDGEIISRARELGMVETSLYANNSGGTQEPSSTAAAPSGTSQETTKGEESGEGKTDKETTAKPEETTAKREETTTAKPQETTTAKREETTTAKPQETTTAKREETTTAKPQETTAKREETTTAKPQETTTAKREETTTAKPQETTAKPQETTARPQQTTTAASEIVLVFDNITSAEKASKILYDGGVIQDVDSFNDYLSENGYARRISEGTFTFTKGMSFEEIAKIITRSRQ